MSDMTTARTHEHRVGHPMGTPRPREYTPKPENFVPIGVDAEGNLNVVPPAPVVEYDPSEYTIDEVKEYVEAHPDEADAILERELDGKDRSGLTTWLDGFGQTDDDT